MEGSGTRWCSKRSVHNGAASQAGPRGVKADDKTFPETAIQGATTARSGPQRQNGPAARLRRSDLPRLQWIKGKKTIITGANSGIGRAVALAFARERADVLVAYHDEHDDANETKRLVEEAGRKCVLLSGDVSTSDHCRQIVKRAVDEFGRIDVLVNNAGHQMSFDSIEETSDEEWEKTLSTNISAMFYIV